MKNIKGNKNKFNLEGGGRILKTINIEDDLIKWFEEQRNLLIAINTNEIIYKAIQLDESVKEKSNSALNKWCYIFLSWYSYSIRKSTYVEEQLKCNYHVKYNNY